MDKKSNPIKTISVVLRYLAVVLIVVLLAVLAYYYKAKSEIANDPISQKVVKLEQANTIPAKLKKAQDIVVNAGRAPKDEMPMMSEITKPEVLHTQAHLKDVKAGDVVVVYKSTNDAFIVRVEAGKIIAKTIVSDLPKTDSNTNINPNLTEQERDAASQLIAK